MQYVQIKQAIEEQISSGMLMPKQKLPSERQLAQSFSTTRITLREALSMLEAEGIIYREDRRGWFISPKPLCFDPTKESDFCDIAKDNYALITPIKAEKTLANKEATRLMSLAPFSNIYQLDRIYFIDQTPVAFARHYIVPDGLSNFLEQNLASSLTKIYNEEYKINHLRTRHKIYTSSFTGNIAQAVRATNGAPTTVIARSHFNQENTLFDCSIEYWRHNAICIEF